MNKILALIVLVLSFGFATPAFADEDPWHSPTPHISNPVRVLEGDPTPRDADIRLVGSQDRWGGDRLLRRMDRSMPGIRILFGGECQTWENCVEVRHNYIEMGEYKALWQLDSFDTPGNGYIMLNDYYNNKKTNTDPRTTIVHEFLHVLGMPHHDEKEGILAHNGYGNFFNVFTQRLSKNEARSLAMWY